MLAEFQTENNFQIILFFFKGKESDSHTYICFGFYSRMRQWGPVKDIFLKRLLPLTAGDMLWRFECPPTPCSCGFAVDSRRLGVGGGYGAGAGKKMRLGVAPDPGLRE